MRIIIHMQVKECKNTLDLYVILHKIQVTEMKQVNSIYEMQPGFCFCDMI